MWSTFFKKRKMSFFPHTCLYSLKTCYTDTVLGDYFGCRTMMENQLFSNLIAEGNLSTMAWGRCGDTGQVPLQSQAYAKEGFSEFFRLGLQAIGWSMVDFWFCNSSHLHTRTISCDSFGMSLDVPCEGSQLSYQNRSHFKQVSSEIQLKSCSGLTTQTTMAMQQKSWGHSVPERNYRIMPVQLVWGVRAPSGSCSCNRFPLLFLLLKYQIPHRKCNMRLFTSFAQSKNSFPASRL